MFEFSLQNISLILITGYLIHYLYRRHASYFEQRNVKAPKNFPVFGFMYEIMFKKRHINDVFGEYYNQFSDTRFFGVFEFLKPVYIIRDLDLIRQISIKDFDNFANHRLIIDASTDKIFGQSLFMLRDQKWRDMRSVLSPAFTGSKMRHMFSLIANISSDYMTEMTRTIKTEKELEFREFSRKYCHDVIAKCAFGVSINSYTDPENEYFKAGKHATEFPLSMQMKFLGFSAFPWLMNFLKVQLFDAKTKKFFIDLVSSNIKYREENDVKINDVINLLMQARKNGAIEVENDKAYESAGFATVMESEGIKQSSIKISKWDFTDITAQCMIFFLAGFEGISTSVYFMAYSLATNPTVQSKLYREINYLVSSLNGRLPSYEDIQKLNYLDMVVCETLRMYSTPMTDRRCNQKTTFENNDGTKVELQPGDGIIIPVNSIHMDPLYYPEPKKFIPERFAPENRDNIKPFTYMPFGVGPRNCIGSRFALMEVKSFFFSLLTHFTIETSTKTEVPLKIKPDVFNMRPVNGVWVSLKKRNS